MPLPEKVRAILDRCRARPGAPDEPLTGGLPGRAVIAPPGSHIPAGSALQVRAVGADEWRPYITTRAVPVMHYRPSADGSLWVVRYRGWELLVAPACVGRRAARTRARGPRR